MQIKELYIENFGKLSGYRRSFTSGLNSFLEDNEFGKTTLTVFIKSMLYGFDDTRKHSLDENDRKKYTPWQGGAFGGWLVFEHNGKSYRIERSFAAKASDDSYTLYDLDMGRRCDDFSENLGEELFGIDTDGFERTVFLSEKNLNGKNTNQTISAKLSNLVGADGDIGGYDAAIKLLDDRRKFYQKKGGLGGIADVRASVSALEDEIFALRAKRDECIRAEAEIAEVNSKIKAIKANKETLLAKQRAELIEKEKRGYEIQYSEMIGAMKQDAEREGELIKFFARKIPTTGDIATAAEQLEEAKRLESTLIEMGENHELSSLRSFFNYDASLEMCEDMNRKAKSVEENKAKFYSHQSSGEVQSPFTRVPSAQEISEMTIKLANSKEERRRGYSPMAIFFGIVIAFFGVILGILVNPILYSVSIVGVLLTIIVILTKLRAKNNLSSRNALGVVRDFITEIYGNEKEGDELEILMGMRAELDGLNAARQRADADKRSLEALREATERDEREVREFIEKFPPVGRMTQVSDTAEIVRLRHKYEMLLEAESENDTKKVLLSNRVKALRSRANEFTSLFPTKTNDAINEIRSALAEFDILRASLEKRRSEAGKFAAAHGIVGMPIIDTAREYIGGYSSSHELDAADEELIAAERRKSMLESNYNAMMRDIERIDELEGRMAEENQKIEVYTENLAIITKAKDMLSRAKDIMTARYLDTTKAGFEKYISLIDDECGEYTMDTSFTVAKSDLGKTRLAEAYSKGTRDLHSLAVRLALIDSLYGESTPPLILDDPFISFDDTRTEKAISVIKKLAANRQILYFTCSKSRRAK